MLSTGGQSGARSRRLRLLAFPLTSQRIDAGHFPHLTQRVQAEFSDGRDERTLMVTVIFQVEI
jgi:hypothetical protein